MSQARLLFLSDTHLGFDFPLQPRVNRRRRGPDFFEAYHHALEPARRGNVDLVLHGGDLFFRSKVHPSIVDKAFVPLIEIADQGVPVCIVPGNHERANIPVSLLQAHPNIHIFSEPKTFRFSINGLTVALCGFPYYYNGIARDLPAVLQKSGWHRDNQDFLFLCTHHLVSGAWVGAQRFVFKQGEDIISGHQVPGSFDLVLCGHIHTAQELRCDHRGAAYQVPVLYAGSTERTSFAERLETKGYYIISMEGGEKKSLDYQFYPLSTRPMVQFRIEVSEKDSAERIYERIRCQLDSIPSDSVVQIKLAGSYHHLAGSLSERALREVAPETMNIAFASAGLFRSLK